MGRTNAPVLIRFLLVSPTLLVAAFAACSSSNGTVGASGTSASSGEAASTTGGAGGAGGTGIDFSTGAMTSGAGGGAADAGCGMTVMSECQTDADCNDNDPTTTDTCTLAGSGSEFPSGTCLHVACDGGPSCSTQAVDPACSEADAGVVYPPFLPLTPPDVPVDCANGFEVCDAQGAPTYVVHAVPPGGSRALTMDLDFATYTAPDGLLITGVDGMCKKYVLFDSCRLKTADQSEKSYTNGMARPKDIAIRQFHLALRPGTTELTFDFTRVESPMYFQARGLCDFALPAAPGVGWFSLVP